ncbi:MAG: peptidylprolyl isomerase [Rhodoluna sp.]
MASKKKTQNIFAASAADRTRKFEQHQLEIAERSKQRTRDNRFAIIASAGAVVVALALQFSYFSFGPGYVNPTASTSAKPNVAAVPQPELSQNRAWTGTMEVGNQKLSITLDGAKAPQAVANFLALNNQHFFNGISCHRLTTAGIFVLQCGDPNGDGTGGPGYNWGPIENAPADNLYKKGVLAMARRGGDGSSMGSQFFIVYQDSVIPSDNAGGYTVFGEITKGLDKLSPIFDAGVVDGKSDGTPAKPTQLGAITLQ